jgi:nucleoside-diphosphate-sugar epimerase
MSDTILVTGATGFIGRALVARLIADGVGRENLRCLVRDRHRAAQLGLPEQSLVEGDLGDEAALRRAVDGLSAVVHLAGLTRALDPGLLDEVNARGTGRLARLAAAAAPGLRFVLVSSLAAAGPSVDGAGSTLPPDRCAPCSMYGRSKLHGELRMLEHSPGLDWCVLRPPIVYGPLDDGTRLLFRQATAPLAFVPWRPRPLSIVHVDDLTAAIRLALDARAVQGFFAVEGRERVDTDALVERFARAAGHRPRRVRVPMCVPRAIAPLVDLLSRARGEAILFNADKMAEAAAAGWVAVPGPAERRLGFAARVGLDAGLAATVLADPWLRDRFAPRQA